MRMGAGSVTSASLLEALDQLPPAKASDMLASILASAADRLAVLNATDTHERLQTVLLLVQQVCLNSTYDITACSSGASRPTLSMPGVFQWHVRSDNLL